jgi:hypothetical protein
MRTAKITLMGKEYYLAFSAQSQINMEAFRRRPDFNARTYSAALAYEMLCEELRAGYRWAQLNGLDANKPPEREDLADLIGMDDVMALSDQMSAVATGERNVIAKPPKKEPATASDG